MRSFGSILRAKSDKELENCCARDASSSSFENRLRSSKEWSKIEEPSTGPVDTKVDGLPWTLVVVFIAGTSFLKDLSAVFLQKIDE